jgi:hypothetical protein
LPPETYALGQLGGIFDKKPKEQLTEMAMEKLGCAGWCI